MLGALRQGSLRFYEFLDAPPPQNPVSLARPGTFGCRVCEALLVADEAVGNLIHRVEASDHKRVLHRGVVRGRGGGSEAVQAKESINKSSPEGG